MNFVESCLYNTEESEYACTGASISSKRMRLYAIFPRI